MGDTAQGYFSSSSIAVSPALAPEPMSKLLTSSRCSGQKWSRHSTEGKHKAATAHEKFTSTYKSKLINSEAVAGEHEFELHETDGEFDRQELIYSGVLADTSADNAICAQQDPSATRAHDNSKNNIHKSNNDQRACRRVTETLRNREWDPLTIIINPRKMNFYDDVEYSWLAIGL